MRVERWISYEEAAKKKESIGGLGGMFNAGHIFGDERKKGMRWKDYLAIYYEAGQSYAEAIRASVLERNIWEAGDWHQESGEGAPLFEDGTAATFSFRAWGDLMAAIWSERYDRDYHYMDFYYIDTPKRPSGNGGADDRSE